MIFQACGYRYEIKKSRKITHEAFTRRIALSRLESDLQDEQFTLNTLPSNRRRRQREKIWRLEQRIDRLRLEIESED